MKTNFYKSFFLTVSTLSFVIVSAQTTLKMGSLGGPSGSGPAITAKTVTLYQNGTTAYTPTLTVSYSLTNQQYGPGSVEGIAAASMMNFGGNLNTGSNTAIGSNLFYTTMNAISNPTNSMFKACVNCDNSIDVTTDRAISLFSCTDAFINATTGANAKALNARVYTGDLTITFNQPVTNPVLQIIGLGGTTSVTKSGKNYDLGFSTEFDLIGTNVVLNKIAGNTQLNISATQITNNATWLGAASQGVADHGITRYAASGSVVAIGTSITSISFKVYVKGDGGRINNGTSVVTADAGLTPIWSFGSANAFNVASRVSGDLMLFGVSVAKPTIALPVHVFEASAVVNATNVAVNWRTENEINTSRFFVERSINNGAFETIGSQAAAGNFAGTKNYTMKDDIATVAGGAIQYRIKLVDIDGKVSYSNTIIVKTAAIDAVKTWPNPFTSNVNIALSSNTATTITTRLFDLSGKLVAQSNSQVVKGNNQLNISNLSGLSKGIYMLQITDITGTINYTQKIIK
jgi:Secretion system C-terminal sorting domain